MPRLAVGIIARRAGEPAQVEQFWVPDPGPEEVVVRMLASGVCHSDLHYQQGSLGDGFPFLLGHEGAGIVDAVGSRVTSPAVGDYVALTYRAPCRQCRACQQGAFSRCPTPAAATSVMTTLDGLALTPALWLGTFASHVVVAADQAIPMAVSCPPERACLLGCGVSTGIGSVLYTAGVRPDQTVAVFGCGGVGMNVIQGARIVNARRIIAVDISPAKLAWATEMGATDLVDASTTDPVERIRDLTEGRGVDVAFEAIGLPRTIEQALWSVDYKGTVVVIGFPAPGQVLNLDLQRFFFGGITLKISLNGDMTPARDMPMLASWYETGRLDLDRLVTRVIGIDDVQAAFTAMAQGETLKSVIRFGDTIAIPTRAA